MSVEKRRALWGPLGAPALPGVPRAVNPVTAHSHVISKGYLALFGTMPGPLHLLQRGPAALACKWAEKEPLIIRPVSFVTSFDFGAASAFRRAAAD